LFQPTRIFSPHGEKPLEYIEIRKDDDYRYSTIARKDSVFVTIVKVCRDY